MTAKQNLQFNRNLLNKFEKECSFIYKFTFLCVYKSTILVILEQVNRYSICLHKIAKSYFKTIVHINAHQTIMILSQ